MKTRRGALGFGFLAVAVPTLLLGFTLPAQSQTNPPPAKTVLLDFGNNITYRGTNTASPDIHGHYWNSLSYAYLPVLTNAAGGRTSMAYGLDGLGGYDSYNGPSGVCTGDVPCPPSACIIDTNALGYLGINEAVYDYFVNAAFEIQGMDPTKTYSVTFFGSHKQSDSDYTTYSLYSDISYSTVVTSISLYVQSPGDHSAHNSNTVATISGISPQPDGIMYFKFQGTNSSFSIGGYLNCMQIVDLSTNLPPPPPPVSKTVLVDFGNNQSNRGTNTPSPDIHGHYWNSVWSGVFNSNMVNAAGTATTLGLGFDSAADTDYYNGPSGPTQNPSACIIDTNALGFLGINEAVYDYYVTSTFQIQGMDPAKTYQLTFFGSQKYTADPTTVYSVCSDASYSTVLASTNLFVGSGASHNQDRLATIGPISPQTNGIMYVKFISQTGTNGYLNCMQIVDLSSTNPPTDPFSTWQFAYFGSTNSANAMPSADPDGDGFSNTNEFLTGFNPTNSAAYPHIISITRSGTTNLLITYLGANGDGAWTPGFASRTNVLEFTTGTANYSYTNNFASTGQTNILSGGTGVGVATSFIETNVVIGPARYYRVRVLVP